MSVDKFIERGTHYEFRNGVLSIYETNCPCKGIGFKFDQFMLTLMLSGHKTILTKNSKVEFFVGTLFIPERQVDQTVNIPHASFTNPTKCLVLDIAPSFLESFYFEAVKLNPDYEANGSTQLDKFFSNDLGTIEVFKRLYSGIKIATTEADEDVNEFILKELLIRLFRTEARDLLVKNFQRQYDDDIIAKVAFYIKSNLTKKITIDDLTTASGVSKSKLFSKFKTTVGMSPVNYIIKKRIDYAIELINSEDSLQQVAYQSGFNSYEHFYNSFKKVTQSTPQEFKKTILLSA